MSTRKTSAAGVKDYRETCWMPDNKPKAADLPARFKIIPRAGIPCMNSHLQSLNSKTGAN